MGCWAGVVTSAPGLPGRSSDVEIDFCTNTSGLLSEDEVAFKAFTAVVLYYWSAPLPRTDKAPYLRLVTWPNAKVAEYRPDGFG